MYLSNSIYYCCISMETLMSYSLLMLLIPYTDAKRILKNSFLRLFLLIAKRPKTIASLVAIVKIFVKIMKKQVFENRFPCTVTSKKHHVKGKLNCNSCNVI